MRQVAKEPPELIQVLGGLGMGLPESVRQHGDRLLLPLDLLRHVIRMTPGLIDFVEQPQPVAILPQPIPAQLAQAFRPLERQPRIDRLPVFRASHPLADRERLAQSLERTGHVVVCRVETRRELRAPATSSCSSPKSLRSTASIRSAESIASVSCPASRNRSASQASAFPARVAPGSDLPRRFARVSRRFAPADFRRPAAPRSAPCEVALATDDGSDHVGPPSFDSRPPRMAMVVESGEWAIGFADLEPHDRR